MLNPWGRFVYRFIWCIGRGLARMLFKFKVTDASNVPQRGPALIACNHVSHLDPPLLCLSLKRNMFHMAKKELFDNAFLLWLLSTIRTIMVDRGQAKQALIDAVDYLDNGACVNIFPEGTRSKTGRLGKGRSGAIVLAIRTGCPVIPAVIIGSEKAMTKGSKRINFIPIEIRFGEPYKIDYSGDTENIPHDVLRREAFNLMERIEEMLPAEMKPAPEDKKSWYAALNR